MASPAPVRRHPFRQSPDDDGDHLVDAPAALSDSAMTLTPMAMVTWGLIREAEVVRLQIIVSLVHCGRLAHPDENLGAGHRQILPAEVEGHALPAPGIDFRAGWPRTSPPGNPEPPGSSRYPWNCPRMTSAGVRGRMALRTLTFSSRTDSLSSRGRFHGEVGGELEEVIASRPGLSPSGRRTLRPWTPKSSTHGDLQCLDVTAIPVGPRNALAKR